MLKRDGFSTLTGDLVARRRRPLSSTKPTFGLTQPDLHSEGRERLAETARAEFRYDEPHAIRIPRPDEPQEPWQLRRRLVR